MEIIPAKSTITPRLPDLPRGGMRVGWTGGLRGDPLMRSRPFQFDQTWTLEQQADLDAPLEMPLEE